MVADAVDDLADRRAAAGLPRQLPVGAVEHVPADMEDEARKRSGRPRQQQIAGAGAAHHHHAQHRHRVGRDSGGDQKPHQRARDRVHEIAVEGLLDLQRPGLGDDRRLRRRSANLRLVLGAARRAYGLSVHHAPLGASVSPPRGRRGSTRRLCARACSADQAWPKEARRRRPRLLLRYDDGGSLRRTIRPSPKIIGSAARAAGQSGCGRTHPEAGRSLRA